MSGPRRDHDAPGSARESAPGKFRAVALAVAVHAAFFALIVFGVTWQSRPTPPAQAELWDKLPPVQAPPRPEPAKPEPPKPEPAKPEPEKPEPPKPEPPKPEVKPEPPKPDPAIAERKEREKREKEKRDKLEREKKDKAEKERLDKAERQKQEDVKKKREDEKRKSEEERAKREAEKAREAQLNARQAEIDSWVSKIKLRIRSKANVPDTVTGNPQLQVRIRILPGGDVLDVTVTRSSGNRAYDAAIERAIRSAQPLPVPPADSELFPQFRDLNLNIVHDR